MNNFFSLEKGKLNHNYFIVSIVASTKIKRRLLDLGFVKTCVKIIKISPFKGTFLIEIRGYIVALKREEISKIMVTNYAK